MTRIVTEIVVSAAGAIADLKDFGHEMDDAGQSTERSTGAVKRLESALKKFEAAQERGLALTTESIARKTAEQRVWERWQSTIDKTAALEIKLRRESEQAAVAASNAVLLGFTSQEDATRAMIQLEQRHAAQLNALTVSSHGAAAAQLSLAAANRTVAASNNFQTGNLAAQFQDIAVTAQMGMSPLQIALQQGTQISAALAGVNSLKGAALAVGGAFASILNPVSLATIAVVGLGAAGIQALGSIMGSTKEATNSLEEHAAWLREVLAGYDKAGDAAEKALERASRLPQGVVQSDLLASLEDQEKAAKALQERIDQAKASLAETATWLRQMGDIASTDGESDAIMQAAASQVDFLHELGVNTASTRAELEAATVAARTLYNTTQDPAIKVMADQVYQLAIELIHARAEADATAAALVNLNNQDILISVSVATEGATDAIARIQRLAPELRTAGEQARDALNEALGKAPDAIMRQAAQEAYQSTIADIAEQERRREALRATAAGARDAGASLVEHADDWLEDALRKAERKAA